MKKKAIITYIYQSSYTVDLGDYFIIFDYTKGVLNIPEDKTVIFVATSPDKNHYISDILKVPDMENKTYILAEDIGQQVSNENIIYIRDDRIELEPIKNIYTFNNIYFIGEAETRKLRLKDADILIETFKNPSMGLSIMVTINDFSIFHVGKVNLLSCDLRQVREVKNHKIDLAFFPIDTDQSFSCADYFIKEVEPWVFFPTEFVGHEDIACDFAGKFTYETTKIIPVMEKNQKILIDIEKN